MDTHKFKPGRMHTGWIGGLILLLGVTALIVGRAEERQFVEIFYQAAPVWLLVAAILQALTYVCAAAGWQLTLASLGQHRPLRGLIPLGLAKLFTDQAVPSAGLSGNVLLVYALSRRQIPRDVAMRTILVGMVAYYGAYALCVAVAMLILWLLGDMNRLLLTLATTFSLLAVMVPLGVFWLRQHPRFLPGGWLRKSPLAREMLASLETTPPLLGPPALIARVVALQSAVFVLDAGTLYVMLRAVGNPTAFAPVFAGFIIASVVATLMVVPGGLGTFEGTAVAMLHLFGVPLAPALAATLLLRGFTFWLPMLPGLWLARREMHQNGNRPEGEAKV